MVIYFLTLLIILLAGIWDIKTNRIPNYITMSAVVLGLIFNYYYFGLQGLGNAVAGTITGTLLLIIPFAFGGIGAGDVKLLAAVGALNGGLFVFYSFFYSAIAGGLISLLILLVKGKVYPVLFNIYVTFQNLSVHIFKRKDRQDFMPLSLGITFPYGIAIFFGTVAAYWLR